MKRLIRRTGSGAFFADGAWTQDRSLAQDFPDTAAAIAACIDFDLRGVEMVLQVDEPTSSEGDIIIPLFPSR